MTLVRWREQILARQRTGASKGPTEGLSLLVKKVKRAGHGFCSFANYRVRILLHAGGRQLGRRLPQHHASAAGLPTSMRRATICDHSL